MDNMRKPRRNGIQAWEAVGAVSLLLALSTPAQKLSRFAEHPEERRQFIEEVTKRSNRKMQEAEAWAKAHGKPMRFEVNGRLYQISSMRNGKPSYLVTHNKNAGISSAANLVWVSPYNLNGSGITVGVWDGGEALTTHQEFGGRVTYVSGQTYPPHYHATHVAGTIAASGVQPNAKGMAPAATIHSYDWLNDIGEMGGVAATAPGQSGKLYLSNHSYGWGVGIEDGVDLGNQIEFGQYSDNSRDMDVLVAGHSYILPFCSAGNDRSEDSSHNNNGYETISHYAVAKNAMIVGAVSDAVSGSTRNVGAASLATFSSCGPCDDGRIKPDIVANGLSVYSPGWPSSGSPGNSSYATLQGTSMSSPSACGSAALLVEYYKELFPPNGAMRASTLKGLIIHTADDRGRPGPDYQYGWGLMNTKAAADLLKEYAEGATTKLHEATVTPAQKTDTYSFQWNGVDPIRVTLCWTDPAGSEDSGDDDRTPDLVNDLDLKVTGPGGLYYPYKLAYANPTANATANSENNVDNVEQVYIASPSAGIYTITVDYDGALSGGNQWYSLLVSGDSKDSDADSIPDSWESLYFSSPTGAVATADSDGDGSDNLTEYIAGTIPTDAASVFKVTSHSASPAGGTPFILNWSTVPGRLYSVSHTYNLQYVDFVEFPDAIDLPHTQNSYTDTVNHAESLQLYRIDVKLEN